MLSTDNQQKYLLYNMYYIYITVRLQRFRVVYSLYKLNKNLMFA